jgi:D-alanyl-D-alanine carboxypeptidase (penicillin-binding protein 5/6)
MQPTDEKIMRHEVRKMVSARSGLLPCMIAFALFSISAFAQISPSIKLAKHRIIRAHATPTPRPVPSEIELPPGEPEVAAQGAVVVDEFTGKPIYAKNPDQAFYPASTTKILTALLVIEEGDLDHEVVVDPLAARVGESSLNLKAGERYTRRQMLYGMMLKSANDVAAALACDNAGSIPAFAEKMTRRAQELGATGSHFTNPHGLHDVLHYTTPHDLSLIARAAMEQPFFRKLVSTQNFIWTPGDGNGVCALKNHNRLLWEFPGCTGLKTGYTFPAQQVLVSSALRDRREVICVVMHTDKPGIWEDSKFLLTYGFAHLPAPAQF